MCGIAGIISQDITLIHEAKPNEMADVLQHRGPDGKGHWINPGNQVGFGHTRLSIIDLSASGNQPMHYLNRYTIVFNGEIYNYLELKEDLVKKGFSFVSKTDTEVILAMYHCYKEKCVDFFDGMFAFAIWDEAEQNLFAARDRFGEKPFFYFFDKDKAVLFFASEMKALWAAGISKEMNSSMLLNFITLGFTQNPIDPFATFYSNIKKLPAAHFLKYNLQTKEINIARYWLIDKSKKIADPNFENCVEHFSELFNDAVKKRLRSDVSIGTSLSGGLDSSSIVGTVLTYFAKDLPGYNLENLKTFSAIFPGFANDESKYINLLSKNLEFKNYQVSPGIDELLGSFEDICYHQEEPFQSSAMMAQYKVFEMAKHHGVKVLLDGQGADEILAGYTKYYHWYWQELLVSKGITNSAAERKLISDPGSDRGWNYRNYIAAFFPELTAKLLTSRVSTAQRNHPSIARDFLKENFDTSYLYKPTVRQLNDILYFNTFQMGLEELLRYADRNSMAHGVEVRLPFLSHQLVEFIFSLPSQFKIREGFTKYVLRKSMAHILPSEITWRTDKIGFETPQKLWMTNPVLQDYIHEAKKKLVAKQILKSSVLQKKIKPMNALEAGNFDWRYLMAATFI
ncbi:MAG: asparagine synthase (glutamine-hydrolyzing) [Bacteroidota bacterium]|nr:asparagine synthase (glutamine-hydrolyzing) [Bacteroidota bacterium]